MQCRRKSKLESEGRLMSSLARTWVCIIAAVVFAQVGFILAAIFGPLIFPLSLTDSSGPENRALFLMLMCVLFFGAAGALLSWKVTARWDR
jgi:hypothetical protein